MKVQGSQAKQIYTATQLVKQSLAQLEAGDVFKGQILQVNKNEILLRLMNGSQIKAKMNGDIPLNVGQTVDFQVQSNADQKIMIKPMFQGGTHSPMILEALHAAELPETPENYKLLELLIENQLPIDRENVHETLQFIDPKQQGALDTLLFLLENHFPIDQNTVSQIQGYEQRENHLFSQLQQIVSAVLETGDEKILQQIGEALLTEKELEVFRSPEKMRTILTQETSADWMDKKLKIVLDIWEQEDGKNVNTLHQRIKNHLLERRMMDSFFLDGKDFQKEKLNDFYQSVYEKIQQLEKAVVGNTAGENTNQMIQHAKQNIEFMEMINQNYVYVQLPLAFSHTFAKGDLYLLKNNQQNQSSSKRKNMSLLLALDTAYLGYLEFFVILSGKQLSVEIRGEQDRIKRIFNEQKNQLEEMLKSKGYTVEYISVLSLEDAFTLTKDITKITGNTAKSKIPTSFDIRI